MLDPNAALNFIKDRLVGYDFDSKDIVQFQQGIEALEEWGALCFLMFLQRKNLFNKHDDIYDLEHIKHCLDVLPKYTRLLESLIDLLGKHGCINEIQSGIYEANDLHSITVGILDKAYENIICKYPEVAISAKFLQKVMESYLSILSGHESFLNIMFPSGSFDIIEHTYKLSPDALYFNQIVAQTVNYYANFYFAGHQQSTSIVELGAGIGSTSEHILPLLQKNKFCSDYMYTDISKTFTRYGEQNFGSKYPFMSFATLNIDKPLDTQGFEKKYDVVIATNVLHATKNILATLRHVVTLLKPNGLLVLNEGVVIKDFSTLVYGLSDGWWAFEDDEWRIEKSPVINLENWKQLLSLSGFQYIESLGQLFTPKMQVSQDVIVGFKRESGF